MRREIGRFEAKADDGQQFTIVEYQENVDVGTIVKLAVQPTLRLAV
jgi:hypothetical protein